MSRNDIRLRRKMMTSRKIESHKDYDDLLQKYKKGSLTKRIFKWTILALVVIFAMYLLVTFF